MPASDPSKEPVAELVSRLEAITDDEVFAAMDALETASGEAKDAKREEILSRIALTEDEIERRFSGQVPAPYRDWKKKPAAAVSTFVAAAGRNNQGGNDEHF